MCQGSSGQRSENKLDTGGKKKIENKSDKVKIGQTGLKNLKKEAVEEWG